jgi:hypothetical protein
MSGALDRRWIHLAMMLAVALPILWNGVTGKTFPESPTPPSQACFDAIEALPAGSRVLVSFDYDPASEGELAPMATTFLRHLMHKGLRPVIIALWPLGPTKAEETIANVMKVDFPDRVSGRDYVNLGFQTGNEGVLKVIGTDFRKQFPVDRSGTPVDRLPIMEGITKVGDFPLVITISAGYPGGKEWVQYVSSANPGLVLLAGVTGVQASQVYSYYPGQLRGMLAAIKGAAEYEALVSAAIDGDRVTAPKYTEARRRMAPQLFGHLLLIALIVIGNAMYFAQRRCKAVAP